MEGAEFEAEPGFRLCLHLPCLSQLPIMCRAKRSEDLRWLGKAMVEIPVELVQLVSGENGG